MNEVVGTEDATVVAQCACLQSLIRRGGPEEETGSGSVGLVAALARVVPFMGRSSSPARTDGHMDCTRVGSPLGSIQDEMEVI